MPEPLPIPETVIEGSTVWPVVYGLDVLGLVPVIEFVKILCPFVEIHGLTKINKNSGKRIR
jgi:hypothetical protein